MSITLSVMIPTIGRPELKRLLDEMAPQLAAGDEILVVGDGPQPEAAAMSADYKGVRYFEHGPDHCWGHPQRNWVMRFVKGSHLMSMDDDDRFAPDGLEAIRRALAESPDRPHMFRMHHEGAVLWREQVVRSGNVSTQMFVTPFVRGRLGKWGRLYEGDRFFIESTLKLYPEGFDALVWRPEITAVHGTVGWKNAVDSWKW